MKITVKGEPIFYLEIDMATVDLLLETSRSHYDANCRQAGRIGGFIYGWNNRFPLSDEPPATAEVRASGRDLDITLKIFEVVDDYHGTQIGRATRLSLVAKYKRAVVSAYEQAAVMVPEWRFVIEA